MCRSRGRFGGGEGLTTEVTEITGRAGRSEEGFGRETGRVAWEWGGVVWWGWGCENRGMTADDMARALRGHDRGVMLVDEVAQGVRRFVVDPRDGGLVMPLAAGMLE